MTPESITDFAFDMARQQANLLREQMPDLMRSVLYHLTGAIGCKAMPKHSNGKDTVVIVLYGEQGKVALSIPADKIVDFEHAINQALHPIYMAQSDAEEAALKASVREDVTCD